MTHWTTGKLSELTKISKSQETELLVRGSLGGIQQELSLLHHKPQEGDRCRMEVTFFCFNKACSREGAGVRGGHAERVPPLSLKDEDVRSLPHCSIPHQDHGTRQVQWRDMGPHDVTSGWVAGRKEHSGES